MQVSQACEARGAGTLDGSNIWKIYLWIFFSKRFRQCPPAAKSRKAPDPNSICPDLIFHAVAALKFPSFCLPQPKLPIIWKRALVIAISRPNKPSSKSKGYTLISLSCIPYKIVGRPIYACMKPIIDPFLSREQAGFRRGKSTTDQITFLTQKIKDSFSAKQKASLSTSQQPTTLPASWHYCKLLPLLPNRHMTSIIMELVRNCSFTLTISTGKQCRLQRMRNGVPQGLVIAPLSFYIYIDDLPATIIGKFAYADGLAILHSASNW